MFKLQIPSTANYRNGGVNGGSLHEGYVRGIQGPWGVISGVWYIKLYVWSPHGNSPPVFPVDRELSYHNKETYEK